MNLFKRNRIFTSASSTSGGGGATIDVVANYAALPAANGVTGEFRWVSASTGIHLTGLYYSNGTTWEFNPADDVTVVANYSALPAVGTVTGQFYWVSASQGTAWLWGSLGGTYYSAGLYYSNGVTWEFLNVPYNATQAEVNTGTNNDKFVTPSTLTNATVITNKELLANKSTTLSADQASDTKYPSVKSVYDWATGLFTTKANNLSDLASAKTARVNLGIDKITNGGNAAYSILLTDKVVYTGTAFTAARVWTLPDASTVNAGYEIIIADFLQTVTSTNTLTVGVQSGQIMDGVTNGTEVMQSAGGFRRFISDGSTKWSQDIGIVRLTKTQTLTNKRITKRTVTVSAPGATPTINSDNCDIAQFTGLSANITSMTTNLTGTPVSGDLLSIEFTDNGTARTITFGTTFTASGFLALPTTTAISTLLRCLFQWNSTTSKWEIIAIC